MLDFIVCIAVAFLVAIMGCLLALAFDKVLRIGERDQPDLESLACLKIPADCLKSRHNFIVDLECPDGTVVRVAIPSDSDSYEGRCSRVCSELDRPVGLNLICPGHYT